MSARRRALSLAAAACLAAAAALAGGSVKSAAAGPIEFVMPPPGAFVPSGPVIVAGRLPAGTATLELILDGAPFAGVTREGDTFSATLTPRPGAHTLEARAGGVSATIAFASGTGGQGAPPYRYHPPVLEGRCADCHAGVRRKIARAEAKTCTVCHRKLAMVFPYVHEPVKEGTCIICHDPHGSTRTALITADAKTLCAECHGEPSAAHIEQGRSVTCHLCHNPHASMSPKFLYENP
jgi:predicted CXXCH cytochrome family protein